MTERTAWLSILRSPEAVRALGPGLYTALSAESGPAPYDRHAMLYDTVLRWSIYHRLAWGASTRAYHRFGSAALAAAGDGYFAEVGCGSLLFTSPLYARARPQASVLIDRSIEMLRCAVKRLTVDRNEMPRNVVLLHADAGQLPTRSGVFSSILGLNLLHVQCDRAALIAECHRTLVPGQGRLFVSSLVRSGRWSDAYLSALHRTGEFSVPMTREELGEALAASWGRIESSRMEGNMAYIVVRHAG